MNEDRLAFNRGAVRPMECLRDGWQLIKDDYWLFLGMAFVAHLLMQAGSIFLFGPMVCGLDVCLLKKMRGRRVSFENLFEGFNFFLQSLLAALVMFVPVIIFVVGFYILVVVVMVTTLAGQQAGGPPDPSALWLMLGLDCALIFGLLAIMLVIQALFLFAFPLIVERKLSAMEAVQLSFRAAMGNFGGVIGLLILIVALDIAGLLACFIGSIFVAPVGYAMIAVAYRQVFPELNDHDRARLEDDPDDDADEPRESSHGIRPERTRSGIKATGEDGAEAE